MRAEARGGGTQTLAAYETRPLLREVSGRHRRGSGPSRPVSTEGWTRRVHFVREGGGGGRPPGRAGEGCSPRAAGARRGLSARGGVAQVSALVRGYSFERWCPASAAGSPPSPLPPVLTVMRSLDTSRPDWTRLVPPPVLTGRLGRWLCARASFVRVARRAPALLSRSRMRVVGSRFSTTATRRASARASERSHLFACGCCTHWYYTRVALHPALVCPPAPRIVALSIPLTLMTRHGPIHAHTQRISSTQPGKTPPQRASLEKQRGYRSPCSL